MSARPILFSAPMVRALLDGRKTHTRRMLPDKHGTVKIVEADGKTAYVKARDLAAVMQDGARPFLRHAPGDRLWVREAFLTGYNIADETGRPEGGLKVWYRATDAGLSWWDPDSESTLDSPPWRSPIHMPRWASRLTLTVTDVRVQRLQDISEADAVAEGCPCQTEDDLDGMDPRGWFRDLWDTLHGPDAWDANPWVAAVTFTVERRNVDAEAAP